MPQAIPSPHAASAGAPALAGITLMTWWPVLIGLLALYLPSYWDMANGIWNQEEHAHGPIVLFVSIYLIWSKRAALLDVDRSRPLLGWTLLLFGLLLYAVGRSQDILLLESGSQIPVLIGTLFITLGMRPVRTLWFALFFLLFIIPLPGFLIDAATVPLKQHISEIAEAVLYGLGYPVARSGVVLTVGPYQLLVADACSGLHSMFTLAAMGTLYLYLMEHKSWLRNGILIASILPIAFAANIGRVLVLALVTYYLGDAAGQGFLHDSAGVLLFVFALLFLFALDIFLGLFFKSTMGNNK